jgi:hypothetical protein
MNHSGDAAEQIVRMSLEGVEVAARISGNAAKEIALLLMAAMKNDNKAHMKLKGKERLSTMLKSGKQLEIFSVKESDLQKFMQGAKQYGIVYCVLRNTKNSPDGLCDIMVKADDAPKISRLVERFKFATVDKAKIESEIVAQAERAAATATTTTDNSERSDTEMTVDPSDEQREAPDTDDIEKLLDDLLGMDEGRTESETDISGAEKSEQSSAEPGKAAEPSSAEPPSFFESAPQSLPPSEPTSESKKTPEKATAGKPSVKEELKEIAAAKKAKEADTRDSGARPAPTPPKDTPVTAHKQPRRGKSKKRGQR